MEEMSEEEIAMLYPKKAALNNGKFNIRLKKFASPHSSAIASPRVSTPSRLHHEIKMEDDDEGEKEEQGEREDDSPDEYDGESVTGTSTGRGGSVSVDGFNTPGTRDSPDIGRKFTKRMVRAPYTHKKNRPRLSAVIGLLSTSTSTNDGENEGRPAMAPVSSTSGAVAAAIPLLYGGDGSIDLPRLTEDERRAILRPADLDAWPNLMTPYIESVLPLNAEAQGAARPVKAIVDGFGSAVLTNPAPMSSSFSYEVDSDQPLPPFATSSGLEFEVDGEGVTIPLAWPRMTGTNGSANATSSIGNEYTNAPLRPLKGRDREKERETAGIGNLDDWSFSRARLAKLIEPSDLGLYPGLLPAAWINHIHTTKGGPERSRLPPFHLCKGATYTNALHDELTSLPNRVLLDGKSGAFNSTSAVMDPPLDVTTALARGSMLNWQTSAEEQKKAGVRGSDVIRDVVYGGAVGEAYANSVLSFVNGAAQSVLDRQSSSSYLEEEIATREQTSVLKSIPALEELIRVAPSYFDDAGEMLDKEGYIGMGLIPLEVRKEAGLASHSERFESTSERKRASREPSETLAKRRRMMSTPAAEEIIKVVPEDDVEIKEENDHLKDLTSAYLSGAILSASLYEHVRDKVISPLTGGLLDVLLAAGDEVNAKVKKSDQDASDWSLVDPLLESSLEISTGASPSSGKEARDELIRNLTRKMLTGEYKRTMWQLTDMLRAKEDVIELDSLVRVKEEMLSEVTQQTDKTKPLRWPSTELDSSKVSKALEQYAQILTKLSNEREEKAILPLKTEVLDHLRLAYIALAKFVPTKDLGRGQWAAWAEYLQQQMAAHQQKRKKD